MTTKPVTMDQMTHQKTQELIATGAQALANELLKKHDHAMVLDLLLVAYLTVAETHACCTQTAANLAVQAGMRLAMTAQSKPASALVH